MVKLWTQDKTWRQSAWVLTFAYLLLSVSTSVVTLVGIGLGVRWNNASKRIQIQCRAQSRHSIVKTNSVVYPELHKAKKNLSISDCISNHLPKLTNIEQYIKTKAYARNKTKIFAFLLKLNITKLRLLPFKPNSEFEYVCIKRWVRTSSWARGESWVTIHLKLLGTEKVSRMWDFQF